jgi:hypothetical protein
MAAMRASALALAIGLAALPTAGAQRCLAAPAAAAEGGETPAPKRAALRGPQSPGPTPARSAAATAKPPIAPIAAAASPIASPIPPDDGACRLACAQAYYFCLASDATGSCGSTWVRCQSDCAAPAPASSAGG